MKERLTAKSTCERLLDLHPFPLSEEWLSRRELGVQERDSTVVKVYK